MVDERATNEFIEWLKSSNLAVSTYVNAVRLYGKDANYLINNGRVPTIQRIRKVFVYGGCWDSYGLMTQFDFSKRKG